MPEAERPPIIRRSNGIVVAYFVMHIGSCRLTVVAGSKRLGVSHRTLSSSRRRPPRKGKFAMFFKAIAIVMAAIAGYYIFDGNSEQGGIFLMLPASAIAVVLLLGWSG